MSSFVSSGCQFIKSVNVVFYKLCFFLCLALLFCWMRARFRICQCLFISLCVCVSVCARARTRVCICAYFTLSVCLSVCLSVYLTVCFSVSLRGLLFHCTLLLASHPYLNIKHDFYIKYLLTMISLPVEEHEGI